jgi:pyridoxal 5'-phosphate synthase pdxS subunit
MSSENPTIIPATNGTHVNGNGVATMDKPIRKASAHQPSFKSEASNLGTFGVKSGLAQMLKGGVIMVSRRLWRRKAILIHLIR